MRRYTRFAGVGVMGFVIQLATLTVLTTWLRAPHAIAVCLSVEAAIVHNFLWHERWTWRDRATGAALRPRLERLVRFNLASGAVSIVGNVGLTLLFIGATHAPVLLANVAAVACLTLFNYLLADRFAFAGDREAIPAGASAAPLVLHVKRSFFAWAVIVGVGVMAPTVTHAAELKSEAVEAWNKYVARVEGRLVSETRDPQHFLTADRDGAEAASALRSKLQRGEIVVENVGGGTIDVGSGTISHWRGYVLIPGITLQDALDHAALRGPAAASPWQEDVVEARVLGRDRDSLRLFLKLQRQAGVSVVYNTEHLVDYQRLAADRATSRSVSTKIAELRDAGTPGETEKPIGQDRGFLWRLHSYWRYQATRGGIVVELESLTLSRDIPWAVRALADPIANRIARESMSRTLAALRSRFAGSHAN